MNYQELVSSVVRLEVENFASGVDVLARMAQIVSAVILWRDEFGKQGDFEMMSNGHMNANEVLNYMVEMDTDALVRGESLRSRVHTLVSFANAWHHDRKIYLKGL